MARNLDTEEMVKEKAPNAAGSEFLAGHFAFRFFWDKSVTILNKSMERVRFKLYRAAVFSESVLHLLMT
jgi:hypothetical protein